MRMLFAPVFFIIYFLPLWLGAPVGGALQVVSICLLIPMLAFAEFTDFLDGYTARRFNEVSDFGKMFDPFADVFLHLSTFTCFMLAGYMPAPCYILILYREFGQNFLRMVAAKRGTAIAARKGGKLKTVSYVVACFVSLAQEGLVRTGLAAAWGLDMQCFRLAGICVYIICTVLAYVSFFDYLRHFGSMLKNAVDGK